VRGQKIAGFGEYGRPCRIDKCLLAGTIWQSSADIFGGGDLVLGIIGGTGLYDMPELKVHERREVTTPYGPPSDTLILGTLVNTKVCFLSRHGKGHRLTPTELPYQANVYAMKSLGVTHLVTVSAVGSLQEQLPPLTIVLPDQIIDRTVARPRSFFGSGVVAHVGIANPFCHDFQQQIDAAIRAAGLFAVTGGIYLCIEGPQFSTKAESGLYRSWGCSVIGMTAMPEARLAREAELCYATLAMVTDFDVWHETEEAVHVDLVRVYLQRNTDAARNILISLGAMGLPDRRCTCGDALQGAIVTDPGEIPPETRERLGIITDRYLPRASAL
jgi:5'-methylthioadenosine phosphorylase